jgi:hypothetical protein
MGFGTEVIEEFGKTEMMTSLAFKFISVKYRYLGCFD